MDRRSGFSVKNRNRAALALSLFFPAMLCILLPGTLDAAEPPRDLAYFQDRALAGKPTFHDVIERIRIGTSIVPDRIGAFSTMHEHLSFPADTDSENDFLDEAYGPLRAEIGIAYAQLAATRGQVAELRHNLQLLSQLVELSTTLYAAGKLDQAGALQSQIDWERMSETLLALEKQEKVWSTRLNVLIGANPQDSIPEIQPLQEYEPAFDGRQLAEEYKSRRFFTVFAQAVSNAATATSGNGPHAASLDIEADAFIAQARAVLEDLFLRTRRYRTVLIPLAEQAQAARMQAYKTGKAEFGALLQGLRDLSDMRREYQAMLGEMHVLKAEVEEDTGHPLN